MKRRGFPAPAGLRWPRGAPQAPAAGAARGADRLPCAATPYSAGAAGAIGLPLLPAPNAPRPVADFWLARPGAATRGPGKLCRTAFLSNRRTTSDTLSSCPCFMSLSTCASSASSLRLICCHLSDISTFRRPTRVGNMLVRLNARRDRIRVACGRPPVFGDSLGPSPTPVLFAYYPRRDDGREEQRAGSG